MCRAFPAALRDQITASLAIGTLIDFMEPAVLAADRATQASAATAGLQPMGAVAGAVVRERQVALADGVGMGSS